MNEIVVAGDKTEVKKPVKKFNQSMWEKVVIDYSKHLGIHLSYHSSNLSNKISMCDIE